MNKLVIWFVKVVEKHWFMINTQEMSVNSGGQPPVNQNDVMDTNDKTNFPDVSENEFKGFTSQEQNIQISNKIFSISTLSCETNDNDENVKD